MSSATANNELIRNQKRAKRIAYWKQYWVMYAMLALPVAYYIIFRYIPMAGNILAFRRYVPGKGMFGTEWTTRYVQRFLKDPVFWKAFKNTLVLSISNLVINFPIPIIFALALNEIRWEPFKKFAQTASYIPRFVSTVVVIAILNEFLSPSYGFVNILLKSLGIEPIYFMSEKAWFRPVYIFSEAWQFTGWNAIIFLAAITGINQDLYEAAELDGAGRLQRIWYVTLPSILPTIMVMLILNVGAILALGFEKVLLMGTALNADVSEILDTLTYKYGMRNSNYSYATAIGLFTGVVGLVLVSLSNFVSKKLTGDGIY